MSERNLPFEAVRAAWASFARNGKSERFHDTVMYTTKASSGAVVTLAENRGHGHFNVELSYETDPVNCYTYSRGSPVTSDWLAPGYGQILQIALPDGAHKGSVSWRSQHKVNISM